MAGTRICRAPLAGVADTSIREFDSASQLKPDADASRQRYVGQPNNDNDSNALLSTRRAALSFIEVMPSDIGGRRVLLITMLRHGRLINMPFTLLICRGRALQWREWASAAYTAPAIATSSIE